MENKLLTSLLFRMNGQEDLAEKIAASIPDHLIENPDTTFADMSMGSGQYLAAVVRRCLIHHEREQILPRIYGWESSRLFTNKAILHNNLKGANLSVGVPKTNMKFNVIIGNPPYQDSSTNNKKVKLWPQFIKNGIELLKPGGFISLITPDSLWKHDTSTCKRQRASVLDHIDLKRVVSADDAFSVGVSIARWYGTKTEYSGSTSVFGDDLDLRQGPWRSEEGEKIDRVNQKVLSFHTRLPLTRAQNHLPARECQGGPNPIYVSGQKLLHTHHTLEGMGVSKLVAPWSASPYSRFHTTEAVGMFNSWMECSEAEFEVLTKIWDLKVIRMFLGTWAKTAGFTPGVERLPDLRGMDDNQAYKTLGLTTTEIKAVENYCS